MIYVMKYYLFINCIHRSNIIQQTEANSIEGTEVIAQILLDRATLETVHDLTIGKSHSYVVIIVRKYSVGLLKRTVIFKEKIMDFTLKYNS